MNILLITTDQQRADSLGSYGNKVCQTPNLDRLAAQGTRFTACRCQNPYCQPSRATMLTGTYPSTHGATAVGVDLPDDMMQRTVAARFADHGYRTAMFGNAHLASAFPRFPTRNIESVEGSALVVPEWHGPYAGFEHAELVLFGHNLRLAPAMGMWNWAFGPPPFGLHYARWLFRDGDLAGRERLRLLQPEAAKQKWPAVQTWHSALPEEDHSTTWIADRAIDWLRTVEGPFMAWVSFCDPHHPMDPPAPWSGMYTAADVAPLLPKPKPGELEGKPPIHKAWATGFRGTAYESANPGGASLKPEQLAVMIAGYYGMVSMLDANIGRVLEALEARGLSGETMVIMSSDHGDLLGDHRMLFKGPVHYDGLLRVPLIVRGGPYEAAQVVDDPVGLVDLAPTMLDAAGLPVPEWMEGRPLDRLPREHVVTENDHDAAFKLSVRTLTTSRYKLTRYVDREGTGELYDLQEDPGETVNLWEAKGTLKLRSELQAELDGATNRRVRSEPKVSLAG